MASEQTVVIGDCRSMKEIHDGSIQLIVSTPPCFEWMAEDHFHEFEQYLLGLQQVFSECYRVLAKGRFICINFCEISSCNEFPFPPHILFALKRAGFRYHEDIIWSKPTGNDSAPDVFERTLVFRKGRVRQPKRIGECRWEMEGAAAPCRGGPVRYTEDQRVEGQLHEELLDSLLLRYSTKGELVLDPFLGNGSLSKTAALLGRRSIGYESDPYILRTLRPETGKSEVRPKVVFQSERRLT